VTTLTAYNNIGYAENETEEVGLDSETTEDFLFTNNSSHHDYKVHTHKDNDPDVIGNV
jgi:hypothetical protein